ncbi:MAG: DUF3761 domain-containing protein [Pseudomonadota bacterium]|nr:DUF3761 domain-containing protein [Pseudomonadota bacterium]
MAAAPALPSETTSLLPPAAVQPDESDLATHDHYANRDAQVVHSPAKSVDGRAPDGAIAQCQDGTYSFSRHRQETASHHGGVANWLN